MYRELGDFGWRQQAAVDAQVVDIAFERLANRSVADGQRAVVGDGTVEGIADGDGLPWLAVDE